MEEQQLKMIVEAALFAAAEPLSPDRLAALFEEQEQPAREQLLAILARLMEEYAGHGVELVEVAGGYRFQVGKAISPWVSRLWEERPARYSRALLETLALIAYRQPITRAEIEEIRGVAVSTNIMKTLQEREWVRVVGHRDVPGRPALYATTRQFLDYFNLKSLTDLPPLAELRDIDKLNAELQLAEQALGSPAPSAAATSDEVAAVAALEDPREGDGPAAAAEGTRLDKPTHVDPSTAATSMEGSAAVGTPDETAPTASGMEPAADLE